MEKTNDADCVFARVCPVCKKLYVPAAQHAYHMNHDPRERLVCSWNCACKDTKKKGCKNRRTKDIIFQIVSRKDEKR